MLLFYLGDYMKRITGLILSIALIFGLVGCAKGEDQKTLANVLEMKTDASLKDFDKIFVSYKDTLYTITNTDNFVKNFYIALADFKVEEIQTEKVYSDDDFYIDLSKVGYNEYISFSVNSKDEIIIHRSMEGYDFYKCDGIFDRFNEILSPEFKKQDNYYSVKYDKETFLYEYKIYDVNENLIEEETTNREPHIFLERKDIICKWIQAGTGILTRTGYFYNFKTGEKSPSYCGQIDSFGNLVSNTNSKSVTISDMFSGKELLVIDDFKEEIADYMEAVISAYFSEDGTKIEIKYHTKQGEEATDIIDLPSEVLEYKGDNK